jgi:hypothetical protein
VMKETSAGPREKAGVKRVIQIQPNCVVSEL